MAVLGIISSSFKSHNRPPDQEKAAIEKTVICTNPMKDHLAWSGASQGEGNSGLKLCHGFQGRNE